MNTLASHSNAPDGPRTRGVYAADAGGDPPASRFAPTRSRYTRAIRVAYLSTHYPHVSHTFIQTEVLGLGAHGIEVTPMALNPTAAEHLLTDIDRSESARTFAVKSTGKARAVGQVAAVLLRHPIAVPRLFVRLHRRELGNLRRLRKRSLQFVEAVLVQRRCRAEGITGIHAHMGQATATVAWYATELARATGIPHATWSVTIHGWHDFVNEDDALLREKVAASDLVVAISDFTRSQLMRIADPAHWDRIRVVRCGIDLDRFAPRAEVELADTPTVVMTARMAAEKGHFVLLDALVQLRDAGTPVRARLIGGGPLQDDVAARVAEFGLGPLVDLLGPLPPSGVADELRRADAFCLPTFAEGLPVVLMEAMAVGVPVVTTYISGIPELVIDGATGAVVPAARPDLLAQALGGIFDRSPAERRQMVDAGRALVRANHDAAANVASLAALLQDCHG